MNNKEVKGKAPLSYIPLAHLDGVAAAFKDGAEKYGYMNFTEGGNIMDYVDAALRHIAKYLNPGSQDMDEGVHHVDRAIASLIIAKYYINHGPPLSTEAAPLVGANLPDQRAKAGQVLHQESGSPLVGSGY